MRQLKITKSITNRESASLDKYLQEIGREELITAEEEVQLAKKIRDGDQRALEKLTRANLRFVVSVAKQYQNQGLDLQDLIAEGNYGLMKAIKNFDWGKDLRFISYAVWWVKQSIIQSLNDNARTIRLPVNVVQDLHRAKKELEQTGKKLEDKFSTLPSIIDLDMRINDEGDTLIDMIANQDAEAPDASFHTKDILKEKMMTLLDVLDDREKSIIGDYFGLTGTPRTLEDIGSDFGLTKERVRQIKEKALRRLRNDSSELFDYL